MRIDTHTGEITHITNYSVSPTSVTRYHENITDQNRQSSVLNSLRLKTNPKFNPGLSVNARRKLTKSIAWLTFLSKPVKIAHPTEGYMINHQIAFITLTLPAKQKHTDAAIKSQCLNQFITEMRKYFGMVNYIWKAELQANGNIHFHIVTDTFIDYRHVREIWNRCINKLGYVDDYEKKFSGMSLSEYLKYRNAKKLSKKLQYAQTYKNQKRKKWRDPNTTDIHKVKYVKNLSAYFRKYLVKPVSGKDEPQIKVGDTVNGLTIKNELNLENADPGKLSCTLFTGRLWNRSQSLSKLKSVHQHEQSEFEAEFRKHINEKHVFTIKDDYFEVYCVKPDEMHPDLKLLFDKLLLNYAAEFSYTSFADIHNKFKGRQKLMFSDI